MSNRERKTNTFRRALAAALVPALMLIASGCSSFFNKEYLVISDHVDDYLAPETDVYAAEVRNYSAMRAAILNMVENGADSLTFTTENYSGDAKEDISRACLEVTRETPIGVYAVEYMTHFCTQILTYYRIEVIVTYKHTPQEIESVISVSGERELLSSVLADVAEYRTGATYSIIGSMVTSDVIRQTVVSEYRNDPIHITELPEISCTFYPGEDAVQKIIEIRYSYQTPSTELPFRRASMLSSAGAMVYDFTSISDAHDVCGAMLETCEYSPEAGSTAYDALFLGTADSEGLAMGYKLLCDLMDLDCTVVEGRYNGEPHFWNIIRIGDAYYHSDISACIARSPEEYFMLRDSDMWGRYWWDTENYVSCTGELTYGDLYAEQIPDDITEETGE